MSPRNPLCGSVVPWHTARLLCGNDSSVLNWFDSAEEELTRKMWAGLGVAGFRDALPVCRFQVTGQLLDLLLLSAALMEKSSYSLGCGDILPAQLTVGSGI